MSPELERRGRKLMKAARKYWEQANKEHHFGAVIWLEATDGQTVIMTRGEYRKQLMQNIPNTVAPMFFQQPEERQ